MNVPVAVRSKAQVWSHLIAGTAGSNHPEGMDFGLYGPGFKSGGGEIFRIRTDKPFDPPSFLYNVCRVIFGGLAAGAWR